jgi:hypothetical protein
LLSVLPTVPAPIPVSFAISEAVFGPDPSDRRIFALFAPRGARALFGLDAVARLRAVAGLLALAGALRLRLALAALDCDVRGVADRERLAVLVDRLRVVAALDVRRVVERPLDLRVALAGLTELGKRFSTSSASERSSLIVPRAARAALLLASSLSPLSVLATCLRSPALRKRSNRSLSFLAMAFSSPQNWAADRGAATLSSGGDGRATLRPRNTLV